MNREEKSLNVKIVRYAKKHNLGNYETEEAELTAEISPSEDPTAALEALRREVMAFFGEKPRAEKPAAKPPAPKMTVSRVNEALGEDAKLVNVTVDVSDGFITVKPREFLGAEAFKRIASKMKAVDAEYVSAGKDSRFTIKA